MALALSSASFNEGNPISARHTCEGEDLSPPLRWEDPPPGARSFALICSDPDAPGGTWYHWAVYDIPVTVRGLDEGLPKSAAARGVRQAVNDFHRAGWGGPCPPKGHGTHRYRFHLLALDVASLALPTGAHCRDVERAAASHVVAEAVLTGTFAR